MSRETETIIARYSQETATKSNFTRRRFDKILQENIADAMNSVGADYKLKVMMGRLVFETPDADKAMDVLPRVFGISSVSRVEAYADANLEQIVEVGKEHFKEAITGKTFAVRAKRIGKHSFKYL